MYSVISATPFSPSGLIQQYQCGTSLVTQWLRLWAPSAGGLGLIPAQGIRSHMHAATKSLHATTKEPTNKN